jgi:hypothetical protein
MSIAQRQYDRPEDTVADRKHAYFRAFARELGAWNEDDGRNLLLHMVVEDTYVACLIAEAWSLQDIDPVGSIQSVYRTIFPDFDLTEEKLYDVLSPGFSKFVKEQKAAAHHL